MCVQGSEAQPCPQGVDWEDKAGNTSLRGLWTRKRHFLAKYWKTAFYTCPHPLFQASICTHTHMENKLTASTHHPNSSHFRDFEIIEISSSKTNSNQSFNDLNPFWILPTGFMLIILHDTPHKSQTCLLHTLARAALLASHLLFSFYPTFFWSQQHFGLKM